MKKINCLYYLLLLLIAVSSCDKKDTLVTEGGPQLASDDQADTIAIGTSLRLSPVISNSSNLNFAWILDGRTISYDSAFTFTATNRGDYRITFFAGNLAGVDSVVYSIHVWGQYENGYFMVEEGQPGVKTGDLAYYSYDSNRVAFNIYKKENPSGDLGPLTSSLRFATIFNGNIYMVAKGGGPLVAADAYTLKETGRIASLPQDDGHAFAGVDNGRGLLSTADGLYPVNLITLTLGTKIAGIDSSAGDMLVWGNYIFVLTKDDGIVILKTTDFSVVKKIAKATQGFALTKNGSVWAAGDSSLMKIDTATLNISEIKLPFKVTNPWASGAWRPGSITASITEDIVYIAERSATAVVDGELEHGGTKIYRYVVGDPNSLSTPFITLPAGQFFYGASVRYNERTKELLVITLTDMFGASSDNRWLIYDAATATLKDTIYYTGFNFPVIPVFY